MALSQHVWSSTLSQLLRRSLHPRDHHLPRCLACSMCPSPGLGPSLPAQLLYCILRPDFTVTALVSMAASGNVFSPTLFTSTPSSRTSLNSADRMELSRSQLGLTACRTYLWTVLCPHCLCLWLPGAQGRNPLTASHSSRRRGAPLCARLRHRR